ncbi:hypothetical protein PG994_009749 [Apiospora phragmitis]|uniref:P-loop containing nucleoside triphosphate hydrolase protein n=1 Tax=Apiospora phragmitis TaxID=2905665 RepID=A0ABR1U7J6_9PEZI
METTRDVFETICGDGSFGPSVRSPECRGGGFDFTPLFIALAAIRSFSLVGKRPTVRRNFVVLLQIGAQQNPPFPLHFNAGTVAISVYTGLQVALLVLAIKTSLRTKATLVSAVLSLVTGLSLALLSHLEHAKSIRPSFIINTYLIATIVFDIARVRTQWLSQRNGDAVAGVLTTSLAIKCVMAVLESIGKQSLLLEPDHHFSLESTSGVVSRSWFWWLNSLLFAGFRKVLSLEDLPSIHEKVNPERLSQRIHATWKNCKNAFSEPSNRRSGWLRRACVWSLRWEILMNLVPKFFVVGLMTSQTFLIQDAVQYIQADPSDGNNNGYGLIGASAFVYISFAFSTGWHSHLTIRTMSMLRGELISLIYIKTTTLPITSVNESAATTLMSTDAQRISETFQLLLIDTLPLVTQLALSIYVLYLQLGAVCVTPIIIAIVSVGLSTVLASRIGPRQKNWLEATQKRINYTMEIFGAMRNVKMLGLAKQMEYNIQNMREKEMKVSRRYRRLHALNITLVNMRTILAGLSLFARYAIVARINGTEGMSISQAITSLAGMMVLAQPLIMILYAVPFGWSALSCFTRIQEFLNEESRVDSRSLLSTDSPPDLPKGEGIIPTSLTSLIRVPFGKADFAWSSSDDAVVKGLETHIGPDCYLTIIVGPVGCGKSTLLKGLLSETSKTDGMVSVCSPEIAYCDQTAWIINGSIRENIIGKTEFDENWYRSIIQATALEVDLRQLPDGDSTIVGSKGLKLSGGQKARVSIARAIYARKLLAILDDVLSGLDAVTKEHVFRRVFGRDGLFRKSGTSVVLAIHSVKRLPEVNLILALNENGEIVEQGTFSELNTPGSYIHTLQVKIQKEEQEHEVVEAVSEPIDEKTKEIIEVEEKAEAEADKSRQLGDWNIYRYYGRALGPMALITWIFLLGSSQTFVGLGQIWINWWAEDNENGGPDRAGYLLGIYAMFNCFEAILTMMAVGFLWIVIVPRSGNHFHQAMITAAMKAPLSVFYETETGVLVNRFSQDIRLADMVLPQSMGNVVFQSAGMLIVVAVAINAIPWTAVVFPPIAVVSTSFNASTCAPLGSCEYSSMIEANAPLFSHFIESLNGLVTIRSYGWVGDYVARNMELLDQSQTPSYHLQFIQRWLVFVLDMIVAGLVIIVMGLSVALRSKLNDGYLGVALVQLMTLSYELTGIVQHWTMLETSIGAITRIKDFAEKTPDESGPDETDAPTADWPSRGTFKFENVFASYGNGKPAVLKDISFTIKAGEKVGIFGRTGSGKSSTTLAILRMIDIEAGKLTLDDVDLTTIKGSVVRERIICLTQEAFIYPGSIRANIDPLSQSNDEDIATALQKVGLWTVLQSKAAATTAKKTTTTTDDDSATAATPSEVLDTAMDTEFLSHGQRQLFCLARALLKPGRVLILDEPTSSVDNQTDAQMQRVIRYEFRGHTVVMIAHRLSSLVDFDKIAVLDGGRLVEFGSPAELLGNASGHFSRSYNKSSSKEALLRSMTIMIYVFHIHMHMT